MLITIANAKLFQTIFNLVFSLVYSRSPSLVKRRWPFYFSLYRDTVSITSFRARSALKLRVRRIILETEICT